ncbi:glutamine--fructose-6-phosphate transaminase (isomerizing) [Hoeflea prorocentri]|uniref:Glutamine--fructose-6-phosphate aminotransferase [isomerizing] n=1 Tax=Hoeflea prorocentri TaxID=1922333 RepID=A0A9X3ZHD8_9HYPH|nr:glutamine--fructose-6-phosphate transaminase (isomerizing) [Hoeflea prorocentri]MCY6380791.1 glutamine--fructose-6-phosphate transaminase (isomerizing) [Hoeflea prorocentri]MDA5398591.1 glutamine--fructose-6-phosphate transaminase (isomerizing) [Hoeflea prorocentri]
MCGIVGIIGNKPVAPLLVDALKRLEYRGYDSAGVATLMDGKLDRRRAEGKLSNLETELSHHPLDGNVGIGHTRWATHGAPTQNNAHPHFCEGVAVVHNGIIENFSEIRDQLKARGAVISTETDTEVIAQLLASLIRNGKAPKEAMAATLKLIRGAYALAVMFEGLDGEIIGARNGPPLAVGFGDGEMFLGSDAIALSPFTDDISYLEDGDWAVVNRDGVEIHDTDGNIVHRTRIKASSVHAQVDKGNHRHFMEKEIYEQPEVVSHTLAHYLDFTAGKVRGIASEIDFSSVEALKIAACGTAYYAGQIGKYWLERYARLPVEIDVASEFRYREMPLPGNQAALFVSQSGETADTLASLRYCKEHGLKIGSIVNVPESTIARESDVVFPILAGPEIGVASTKAFTCQLATFAALTIAAGRARGTLIADEETNMVRALSEVPRIASSVLNQIQPPLETLSRDLARYHHVLYLGRGTNYTLAMEGALKLKEISYIHAEGYAAGELKHGPIALIDENMPVIVIAPSDRHFEKTVSNMQEVAARGGRIIFVTDEKGAAASDLETMATIVLPDVDELLMPLIFSLPIQLIAYYTAVFMGTDVDQPRNLAKSVTVE